MAVPSYRPKALEDLASSMNPGKRSREGSIKADVCTWCGQPATEFKDALSRREYSISGFCQACQDKTFGE